MTLRDNERDIYHMERALEAAREGWESYDEVPIGCVIVHQDKIICTTHNRKQSSNIATAHAEMLAINEACKRLGRWRLSDCELYVTVEPCIMCVGALIQCRIRRLIYGCQEPKFGGVKSLLEAMDNPKNNHKVEIQAGVCPEQARELMKSFFETKRPHKK